VKCVVVTVVCMCVCLSVLTVFPQYCTDMDVSWGNGRGCPLVVQYWADLQSVHGFRCYDHIVLNAKCQRVLVLALCLVMCSCTHLRTHGRDVYFCRIAFLFFKNFMQQNYIVNLTPSDK